MGRILSSHDKAKILLFLGNQNDSSLFPLCWFCPVSLRAHISFDIDSVKTRSSSIWKVGKEGGKCNFLLFDDKREAFQTLG